MREIQPKDAKELSAVIDQAVHEQPGDHYAPWQKEAVVLSFAEYEKLAKIPDFRTFVGSFPGEESDIPVGGLNRGRAIDR